MSNKKWRTPADGMDAVKKEFERKAKEELDKQQANLQQPTGIPELDRAYAALQMATGVQAPHGEPAPAAPEPAATATEPPAVSTAEPAPTATASDSGDEPVYGPGGYYPDLRMSSASFHATGRRFGVLSEGEVINMLGDVQRFLWKVVRITMDIVDSVPIGELRRVVAEDLAQPGDIVGLDGKLTKGITPGVERGKKGSRGSNHPMMALLKLALQATKVLRQTNEGTNPELQNRVAKKEMLHAIKRAEDWIKELVAGRA